MKTEAINVDEAMLLARPTSGGYIFKAMLEVADELGAKELRASVSDKAIDPRLLFPRVEAFALLETTHPGSAELVMSRTEEIVDKALAEGKSKISLLADGKTILGGIAGKLESDL
jgi:hypothetical protein